MLRKECLLKIYKEKSYYETLHPNSIYNWGKVKENGCGASGG
jgi:hypothetical protein